MVRTQSYQAVAVHVYNILQYSLVQATQRYTMQHRYAGMYPSLNCCSSFHTSSAFLLAFIASLILSFSAAVMSLPEAPGAINLATVDTSDSFACVASAAAADVRVAERDVAREVGSLSGVRNSCFAALRSCHPRRRGCVTQSRQSEILVQSSKNMYLTLSLMRSKSRTRRDLQTNIIQGRYHFFSRTGQPSKLRYSNFRHFPST